MVIMVHVVRGRQHSAHSMPLIPLRPTLNLEIKVINLDASITEMNLIA